MNEFKQVEETIKKEKEFYAKVNYFKLLIKLRYAKDTPEQLYNGIGKVEFSEANYEKFCLLDGINNVNQLLIDIKECMGIDFLYVQLPPEVKMNTNLSKEIEEQKSKKIGER